jgi:hypothetical protein
MPTLNSILALVLEELNEPSDEDIADRLKAMPKGVSGIYERILRRLGSKGTASEHKMRRKLLVWVALAIRPITVSEMQYACITRDGGKHFEPDSCILPNVKKMIECCGHLIEVFNNNQLRFTHRTVKEFLLQPLDKLSELSRRDEAVTSCMVNEVDGHAWITMTCGR